MSLKAMYKNIKESSMKALLSIFIGIGVICLLASFYIDNEVVKEVAKESGSILLAGAAFAAILKSFQFSGLYQQELLKIFQDKAFENTIVDAVHFNNLESAEYRVILTKLLAKFLSKKFPSLSQDISDGLLHYSDTTNDFYYDSYVRHITIESYNKTTKEIIISDNMTLRIDSPSASKEISYAASSIGNAGTFDIESLSIENQERKNDIEISDHEWKYSITLSGRLSYHVKRKISRKFKLSEDPYMHSRFRRFSRMCSVDVENKSPEISFFLMCVGARNDQKTEPIFNGNLSHASLYLNNLVFPGQGYVIVFAEQ